MSNFKSHCECDPFYKLIESVVDNILITNLEHFDPAIIFELGSQCSLDHNKNVHYKNENENFDCCEDSQSHSKKRRMRHLFRERCIKSYPVNIFRGTSVESIDVTFTWSFLKELPCIWRCLLEDYEQPVSPEVNLSDWNLDKLQLYKDSLVRSVVLPPEKYKNLEINLSPLISQSIIGWALKSFPRKVVRKQSCRTENCRVSIGVSDLIESSGNTPFAQYRKFLIAKFIVRALGKSGYIVDPDRFYALPNEDSFANNLFIVSDGLFGAKMVQRLLIGRVTAKHVTSQETKVCTDVTAEYFHNLRLKGVKAIDGLNDKLPKIESDMDLSWLISAANLTTAKMNYDLLMKDPNSDIELLVVDNQENAGILLIMYNYARLMSIINKFDEAVSRGEYPQLPSVETVDFSSLRLKEELDLLRFIWEWPRIIERTVDFIEQKLNIPYVIKSMKELAVRFNNFYSANMVLVPANAVHNFEKMYARIYMLHASKNVFEEFLEVMQVEFNGTTVRGL